MKTLRELGVSPAPWITYGVEPETRPNGPFIYDENSDFVASLVTERGGGDTAIANARLIAAAPLLYTALRILIDTVLDGYTNTDLMDVVVKYGQMAISKVEKGDEE